MGEFVVTIAAETDLDTEMEHQPIDVRVSGHGGERGFDVFALEHEAGVERIADGGACDWRELGKRLLSRRSKPGHRNTGSVADVSRQYGNAATTAKYGTARSVEVWHPLNRDRHVEQFFNAVGRDEARLSLHGVPDLLRAGERSGV